MNTHFLRTISTTLLAATLLALAPTTADAKSIALNAFLDGAQANSGAGTGSPGTGIARVTLDDQTLQLSWEISWQDLNGTPNAMHFHGPAAPGVNAGVTVGIGVGSNPAIGSATITAAQATDLLAGLWYVNLHTSTNGGGEIRGQVGRNAAHYWPLDESAGTEIPDTAGDIEGFAEIGADWVTDGERGQVLEFDGVDGFADLGFETIPVIDIDTDFTWAFWALTNQPPNNNVILGNRFSPSGVNWAPLEWIKFTTNRFEFRGQGTAQGIDYPDIPQGVWVHHAVVKQKSSFTYYRNGVPAGFGPFSTATANPQPLYLGGDVFAENWAGRIDDVALWNHALPPSSVAGLAGGTFSPDSAPVSPPATPLVEILNEDFESGLANWTPSNRGLENNAPAFYDPPATTGGVLTLGGIPDSQFWYGSSVESNQSFPSAAETLVEVDRVSLDGFGSAFRSSLWVFGDAGHYLHYSQDVGETGWQFNARDDGGAGTLNPTGSATNITSLDPLDAELGNFRMGLRVIPGETSAQVTVQILLDGELHASHAFTNFPPTFKVILTGQARAINDEVTAVFDNLTVSQEEVDNLPPAFASTVTDGGVTPQNAPFTLDVSGLASDDENDPLTFSKVGGAAWAGVSPAGVISGTPTDTDLGISTVTVQVEDIFGGTAQTTVSIRVLRGPLVEVFRDGFDAGLGQWDETGRGLENNGLAGYDPADTTGDVLTLGGLSDNQYWFGNSLESSAVFPSSVYTEVEVDRVSIDGFGTAWRSSLWLLGDDGHYLHFSQNVGETGWQFNARDDGGTGTQAPGGSATNIPSLDGLDTQFGRHKMALRVVPGSVAGSITVQILLDEAVHATHTFTNFPPSFQVVLTGQARANFDEVTAVFDNLVVSQEQAGNLPPAFQSTVTAAPDAPRDSPYQFDLAPLAFDAEGDALTFTKIDGPEWAAVSAAGLISGTPTAADLGFAFITVQVEDPSGAVGETVVSLRVSRPASEPAPLFGWWPLNEGSGAVANDVSGNGRNGTIFEPEFGGLGNAGEAWVVDPECGMVLSFSGENNFGTYVLVEDSPNTGALPLMTPSSGFTWSFWARSEQDPNNDIILGNRYDEFGGEFAPQQFVKFTTLQFEWRADATSQNINYADIPFGLWVHHVVVKAGSNLSYYRDGVLANSRTISVFPDLNLPLFFGGQGVENWQGYLSDIRLYSDALTADEVTALYDDKGGLPPTTGDDFAITQITRAPGGSLTLTWGSQPNESYTVEVNAGLGSPWISLGVTIPSAGSTTSTTLPAGGVPDPASLTEMFLRIRRN